MDAYVGMFKEAVVDQVAERMHIEQRAGCPQGLTNRTFEGITRELMLANWDRLSLRPVGQVVAELCGIAKPFKAPSKRKGKRK